MADTDRPVLPLTYGETAELLRSIGLSGAWSQALSLACENRGIVLVRADALDRLTTPSGDTAALQKRLREQGDEMAQTEGYDDWGRLMIDAADALARLEADRDETETQIAVDRQEWGERAMRAEAERDVARADHARTVAAIHEAQKSWDVIEIHEILRAALDGSVDPGRDPIREAQAEAWDKGWESGHDYDPNSMADARNPYRAALPAEPEGTTR